MDKQTFVISDESVNSYGSIVKTDGIDTTAFERNPVMLYMHERKTVVGRWENIRKDGDKLLADAVFDESTELGRTVKAQVENGFLRSASIGVRIIEDKDIKGVNTITKSELIEVSIVDIPSNRNALKLYRKGKYKCLTLEAPHKVKDLRAEIITLLALSDDVTDEDIIAEIQRLLNMPDETSTDIEEAIKAGFIESKDKGNFLTMARISPQTFHSFISREKERRKKAVLTAIDVAIRDRRIYRSQKDAFARVGCEMGLETLSSVIGAMPRALKLSEVISGERNGWMLEDYRRYAPDELKKNPKLYAELIDKESSTLSGANNGKQTLDYLRKNNPKYLEEHPEEYEKLLANI